MAAGVPEFISDRQIQTRADVTVRVRSNGAERSECMVYDGFAVTTPVRTVAYLAPDRMDGGHPGRIACDALVRGPTTRHELESVLAGMVDIDSVIEQATGKAMG